MQCQVTKTTVFRQKCHSTRSHYSDFESLLLIIKVAQRRRSSKYQYYSLLFDPTADLELMTSATHDAVYIGYIEIINIVKKTYGTDFNMKFDGHNLTLFQEQLIINVRTSATRSLTDCNFNQAHTHLTFVVDVDWNITLGYHGYHPSWIYSDRSKFIWYNLFKDLY